MLLLILGFLYALYAFFFITNNKTLARYLPGLFFFNLMYYYLWLYKVCAKHEIKAAKRRDKNN